MPKKKDGTDDKEGKKKCIGLRWKGAFDRYAKRRNPLDHTDEPYYQE